MKIKNKDIGLIDTNMTLRGTIIGVIGLIIITVSSLYVALKLGALPWPTVFVTILSMNLLNRMKNSTLQEVNCTHTLMSAGSMVAGGLAFTLPGLWIINPNYEISYVSVLVSTLVGAILGTVFTSIYRKSFIEVKQLPYPIGEAAYKTLLTWQNKKSGLWLFPSLAFSAVFTFIRDFFGKIPTLLGIYKGNKYISPLTLYVSPMAFAIGAMIGTKLALFWALGMISGYFMLTPIGISTGLFESMVEADSFRSNLGLGIMIGTGLAIALKAIITFVISISKNKGKASISVDKTRIVELVVVLLLCMILLVVFTDVKFYECILLFIGCAFATYLSGMLTGETGINPMEVFALIVMIAIGKIASTSILPLFIIAIATAVAGGLSGDVMNDFKSGYLIGTPYKSQLKAEAIGGIIGAIIAASAIFVLKSAYTFGSAEMPAPQATNIAKAIGGLDNPLAFGIGIASGVVLCLLSIPSSLIGLGMYLGTYITISVCLGALVMFIINKAFKNRTDEANLVSAGLLGGEGFAGVIISFIKVLSV